VLRIILIYGIIGGLIVAVPMAVTTFTATPGAIPDNAALYGYFSMLLAFTMVFVGIKHYRDKALGGVIRFLPALGVRGDDGTGVAGADRAHKSNAEKSPDISHRRRAAQ
jgi:hypothetical protein